jgi:hypothetical protein
MRRLDHEALRDFEQVIKSHVPGFEVGFKDTSKLMAVLGFLARPFNSQFMERYTTTWGKGVYFPSKAHYLRDPARSFRVLAHELVHLWDGKWNKSFKLTYSLPQLLILLPLLAYGVLAWPHSWIVLLPFVSYLLGCVAARWSAIAFWVVFALLLGGTGVAAWWFTGWWGFVLLGAVLFLIPWPAYWRTKWEIRGYGMNVALIWWLYQRYSDRQIEGIVKQFTGPGYFFMCWSGDKIRLAMRKYRAQAETGELQQEHPYGYVRSFLEGGE